MKIKDFDVNKFTFKYNHRLCFWDCDFKNQFGIKINFSIMNASKLEWLLRKPKFFGLFRRTRFIGRFVRLKFPENGRYYRS